MRGMTWLVGVLVVLLGLELRPANSGGWAAVWISAAVLWFFVGCVLGVYALAKIASAKIGARVGGSGRAGRPTTALPGAEVRNDG